MYPLEPTLTPRAAYFFDSTTALGRMCTAPDGSPPTGSVTVHEAQYVGPDAQGAYTPIRLALDYEVSCGPGNGAFRSGLRVNSTVPMAP